MRFAALTISLIATVATAQSIAATKAYKCSQPDGRVTFQDQPCQNEGTESQIVIKPSAPGADPAELERRRQKQFMDFIHPKNQPPRIPDPTKTRLDQIEAYNKSSRCQAARSNLGALKSGRPVYRFDNKGERQYIDEADWKREVATAERAVAKDCP